MALTSRGEARATGCASAAGRLIFHRVVRGPGKGTSRALRRRFEIACPMENTVGRAASRKSRRSTARASGTLLTTIGPWPAAGWRRLAYWPTLGVAIAAESPRDWRFVCQIARKAPQQFGDCTVPSLAWTIHQHYTGHRRMFVEVARHWAGSGPGQLPGRRKRPT